MLGVQYVVVVSDPKTWNQSNLGVQMVVS
jgi:hypothetical protein